MAPALRFLDAVSAGGVGLALAILYDVLHLLAGKGRVRLFISDLLTFAAAAVLLVSFSLSKTYTGQLRWYMAAGALAGFLAFRQLISPLLAFLVHKIIWLLCLPFCLCLRYLLRPVGQGIKKAFASLFKMAARSADRRREKRRKKKGRVLYDSQLPL